MRFLLFKSEAHAGRKETVKKMARKDSWADTLLGPVKKAAAYFEFGDEGGVSQFISPAMREYDIAALPGQWPLVAQDAVDADERDAVMARLGRFSAQSQPREDTRTPLWAAKPSAWIAPTTPAYVGGASRSGKGGGYITDEPASYLFQEPDVNSRGPADEGFGDGEDQEVYRPNGVGTPNFRSSATPTAVGGIPVRKRAARQLRPGFFTSAVFGDRR